LLSSSVDGSDDGIIAYKACDGASWSTFWVVWIHKLSASFYQIASIENSMNLLVVVLALLPLALVVGKPHGSSGGDAGEPGDEMGAPEGVMRMPPKAFAVLRQAAETIPDFSKEQPLGSHR